MYPGWGHVGKDCVTMPGKGKMIERDYTAAEKNTMTHGASTLGMTVEQAFAHLGQTT